MARTTSTHRAGIALALLCSLILTGCGFHLRGLVEVPEALQQIHLTSQGNSQVLRPLQRQLKANGIRLVDSADQAPYRLTLLSESHDRRSAALTSRGKTEEYELRSQLQFDIRDSQGKTVLEPQNLLVERVYTFDEDNINAKDAEEALLRREMREELARQVVRRYLSLTTL